MDYIEIADRFISILFPQRCLFCDEVVAYDDFWCGKCVKDGKPPFTRQGEVACGFPRSFAAALAAVEYGGARELILRLKKKEDKRILRFFADELLAAMSEYWSGVAVDIAVPVPATGSKRKARGFNPAETLAGYVSRRIGIPLCGDALVRVEDTKAQHGLTAAERRVNAEKSYILGQAVHLAEKRILLVDDVFTTGSTAEACSRKLLEAGADSVYVLTAAFTRFSEHTTDYCNHSKTVV